MDVTKVEQVGDIDVLSAIRGEWQALFGSSNLSPFSSWEWMSTWFKNFGEGLSPVILKTVRDGKLTGILPMFQTTTKFAGMSYRRLGLMGDGAGGADHLDVICRPEDRVESIAAILDYLNAHEPSETISFDNIDSGSVMLNALIAGSRKAGVRRNRVSRSVIDVCPQIDLTEGWESVLSRSKRADNFKRKLKKLAKLPGFDFRSVTSTDETDDAFERFLDLHEKRWKNAGGSELSGHPRLIAFQRQLVKRLAAAGMIRFDELWLDGKCRSSIYGLDNGQNFYYYNSGYDQEFSNLSVGLVLLGLSIRSAIERGNMMYDFLRGDETYKSDWANERTELVSLRLGRNTPLAIAQDGFGRVLSEMKGFAKNALPSEVAESIGNWRRSKKRSLQLSGR